MESDVKSARANATGTLVAGPVRLKAMHVSAAATAGTITFRDGGASGTTLCVVDTPALATATIDIEIPENGIRFSTDIHATLTNASAVTIFYA